MVVEAAPVKAKGPVVEEKSTAKAGKRSSKAVKEVEQKQAKEERKTQATEEQVKPKPAPVSKSRAERAGKKYRQAYELIDKTKEYSLTDALELAAKTSPTKFDGSIELHINLGVDPRQADQNIRDMVALPAGTGRSVRIAVLAEADEAAKAKAAGADVTGEDAVFGMLDKEELGFDVLIATPSMMPRLGKYARLLGPRGLMPNPKSGTVSANTAEAVKEAKAGKVEYRVDQSGIIHLGIGKASFGKDKLTQNADAVMNSVRAAKPASLKGIYIKSIYVTSTMGPSVKVTV
ncbi:50S ribosomal protein L1 [Candidatus Saccharibacteria bacterium]|nr:50S ribosomal protein L1 [Candidatus Saccharibacteria bacterium]